MNTERMPVNAQPSKIPLHSIHRQSGARMISLAGGEIPGQYSGPIPEHPAFLPPLSRKILDLLISLQNTGAQKRNLAL
jgi:hypothetical protein